MLVGFRPAAEEGQVGRPGQRGDRDDLGQLRGAERGPLSALLQALVDQADRGVSVHRRDARDRGDPQAEASGEQRPVASERAEFGQVDLAGDVHDGAGAQEQQRLEQRVIDHVIGGSGDAERGGAGETHGEHAHLRDRVPGQQPLEVVLGQRQGGAEHGRHGTEHGQQHRRAVRVDRGEDLQHQPGDDDDADLVHQRGEQGRHRAVRRRVRVRQPAVEGHDARLGGEAGDQQGEREQVRHAHVIDEGAVQLPDVQRAVVGVQHGSADEHQEARDGGEHQCLERRLQCRRAGEEEAGQAVAGQCGHLEPDEGVHHVGGERGADDGRQQ